MEVHFLMFICRKYSAAAHLMFERMVLHFLSMYAQVHSRCVNGWPVYNKNDARKSYLCIPMVVLVLRNPLKQLFIEPQIYIYVNCLVSTRKSFDLDTYFNNFKYLPFLEHYH